MVHGFGCFGCLGCFGCFGGGPRPLTDPAVARVLLTFDHFGSQEATY